MTTETIIHLAAKSYFIAYIIMFSVYFLFSFSKRAQQLLENRIQAGTFGDRQTQDLICMALFILSCYLK